MRNAFRRSVSRCYVRAFLGVSAHTDGTGGSLCGLGSRVGGVLKASTRADTPCSHRMPPSFRADCRPMLHGPDDSSCDAVVVWSPLGVGTESSRMDPLDPLAV